MFNRQCGDFVPGEYKVTVTHAGNCMQGPTKWEAKVIEFGRVKKAMLGTSNEDDGALIHEFTVDF